jgi:hypothetical protein
VKELLEGQQVALQYELQESALYVRGVSDGKDSFLLTAAL